MRLHVALLAFACVLSGCMQGPVAPRDSDRDAYGFRAAIDTPGSEPVYRFDIAPDIEKWLSDRDIHAVSVFDANGQPQACGSFASASGPLESTAVMSRARISTYDEGACAAHGEPLVCFKDHPCDLPEFCPRTRIDLTLWHALAGIDTLPKLLAIANAPPDPCEIEGSSPCTDIGFNDDFHAEQRLVRRAARSALYWAHLDALLTPDPPPPPRTTPGVFNPGNGGESAHAKASGVMLSTRQSDPAQKPHANAPKRGAQPAQVAPAGEAGDYVVEFDEPASEIRLHWTSTTQGGDMGTTETIAYDANGMQHTHADALQPFGGRMADGFEQVLSLDMHPRAMRVIVHSNVTGLRLVGATSTKHEPKPFYDGTRRQFWFAASGAAPYALYAERRRGLCTRNEDPRRMAAYPRINDVAWPPAATIGAPRASPRGPLAMLTATNFSAVVWLYWLALMFALWVPAAAFVGARWWRVRRFEARQRRTR